MRREPPEIEESLDSALDVSIPQAVEDSHRALGCKLSGSSVPALALSVAIEGAPIVGVSRGLESLTGVTRSGEGSAALLGRGWRVMLAGLEDQQVSRSSCEDIDNFLRMTRLRQVDAIADCCLALATAWPGGGAFTAQTTWRLTLDLGRPLVLVAVSDVTALGAPECRLAARRDMLALDALAKSLGTLTDVAANPASPLPVMSFGGLYPVPLSARCVLSRGGSVGMRREPHKIPRGCVLMSADALSVQSGIASFEAIVERTLPAWASRLPFLGFTCTPPWEVESGRCFFGDSPHAFCLGESVTIGGVSEAYLRADEGPLSPVMGQRLQDMLQRKVSAPELPESKRCAPVSLKAGDVLGCRYHARLPEESKPSEDSSSISLLLNGAVIMSFELRGQLPVHRKPVYAVLDVCFSVYQLSYAGGDRRRQAVLGG